MGTIALADDPIGYEDQGIVTLFVGRTRSSIPALRFKLVRVNFKLRIYYKYLDIMKWFGSMTLRDTGFAI